MRKLYSDISEYAKIESPQSRHIYVIHKNAFNKIYELRASNPLTVRLNKNSVGYPTLKNNSDNAGR